MEKRRFIEYYFCDALRLAQHLAERYGGTISEGIGDASNFPMPPKFGFKSDDVRFLRVEGKISAEVGFISQDVPPAEAVKHRNKSLYRVLVGEELQRMRLEKGLTLDEVAEKSGFRSHSLGRVEEGRYDFDIAQLGTILDAMGAGIKIISLDQEEGGR